MSRADELDAALEVAVAIAREAGLYILQSYRTKLQVTHKGAVDLVTEADLGAERIVRGRLAERFPGEAVLAEESGASGPEDAPALWLVDPLDGTTNFAHGHPVFAVSIARESAGRLDLGVVHAPALGLTWAARAGGGTRRNGEPARVSGATELSSSLVASGFPYDRWTTADSNLAEWGRAVRTAQGARRCGAAAVDLAMVADGTYDAYWEKRLNPWDVAAGALLVAEAGGRVESLEGSPLPPWPETVVASNGLVHLELVAMLREAGRP